jgi:hypothetical protein
MKVISCLCFCGLSIALSAQSALQTFTSPDGVFRFKYSPVLIRCTAQPEGQSRWWVPDECNSQDALCGDISDSTATIVCFAYPKDKFKNKPTFSAAALFVAEVRAATTKNACLEGSQNWLVEGSQMTRISSVDAKLFRISDNWTSGGQMGEIYRLFHDGMCYEVGIQQAHTNSGAYDPGTIQEFTKRDQAQVDRSLRQALHSFVFLK